MDQDQMNKNEKPSNKWEDIDGNMLLNIIASFSFLDIIFNVSFVCKSWRSVIEDHYCMQMKQLNLTNVRNQRTWVLTNHAALSNPSRETSRLIRILANSAVSRKSYGYLTGLVFENYTSFTKDSQLLYAANRCPNLKNLELPSLQGISEQQLASAFKTWPKLESLVISFLTDEPSPIVLQSIGENCKELKSLRFRAKHFFKDTAHIITNFMPNLRILSFWSERIQQLAVMNVLKISTNLEEIYISHKAYHDMGDYGLGNGIITLCFSILLQDEAIVYQARWLRVFHVCNSARCSECPNHLDEIGLVCVR